MAAGLGFKTFAVGEVLTAADTNGYLMQGVLVFASAAARDAAITSPQEGQFAYLKDTNVTTYYTGSAWANLDTTGMTNPMTTTGDTIYSSSGSTPARLGIGTTGQVLTVSGGVPTWASAGGGGSSWSLFNSGGTALSGNTTTVSGISGVDKILVVVSNYGSDTASDTSYIRFNSNTGSVYRSFGGLTYATSNSYAINQVVDNLSSTNKINASTGNASQQAMFATSCFVSGANSSGHKQYCLMSGVGNSGTSDNSQARYSQGIFESTDTISSVTIGLNSGNFDSGSIFIYTSVS